MAPQIQNFIDLLLINFYDTIYKCCWEYKQSVKNGEKDPLSCSMNEYILYKLWKDYGIKRKEEGDDIYLLTYDKNSEVLNQKLKKVNDICEKWDDSKSDFDGLFILLCKHLVIDMNSMAILSLGNVKCSGNGLNWLKEHKEQDLSKCTVELLSAGTMIVYNKKLSEDERLSKVKTDDYDPAISTRKKIGTSYFNFNNSFSDYFRENNKLMGFDESKLNPELCYVFNCEVIAEHTTQRCCNMLINCYSFKSIPDSLEQHKKILSTIDYGVDKGYSYNQPYAEDFSNPDLFNIKEALSTFLLDVVEGMVVCIDIGKELKRLYSLGSGTMWCPKELTFNTAEELKEYMEHNDCTLKKGIAIYNEDGLRFNIIDKYYDELEQLRGNLPLNPNFNENKENLFKIYWKLAIKGDCEKFLSIFDPNGIYKDIFIRFHKDMEKFASYLYSTYHKAYVQKTLDKKNIDFILKKLCYDIHGMYLKDRVNNKVTPPVALRFIKELNMNQVYWRIYEPDRFQEKTE